MKQIGPFICLLFALAAPAYTQSIQFEWDVHPKAAQLAGYRLYQTKTPGTYTGAAVATFSPGTLTTGSIPDPGLGNFCWVLTAFIIDFESEHSNEVCKFIIIQPPRLTKAVLAILKLPGRGLAALAQVFIVKRPGLRITS